jgi:hypothetical protein
MAGCARSSDESPPIKIDNSTTWQQKAYLAVAESKKQRSVRKDNAEQMLLASLNQLAESKGQANDPEFSKLMLYYLPDIVRSERDNPKKAALIEAIYKKKVEICRKEFGENTVQNCDALVDLYTFESAHDHEQARSLLTEAQTVNRALKDKGTPYDTSEWSAKKEAHSASVTGIKTTLPTYAIATKDIPAGGVITADSIKEISAPYSQHPSGALPGGGSLIGCRTVKAINKDSAITTTKICHRPGSLMWDTILPTDAKWIQTSKLASTTLERKDYRSSLQHYNELADELTKLANEGTQLTDYCDNCYLSTIMSYDTCAAAGDRRSVDKTKSSAWHKRVLAALTKLCPEGSDHVKYEREYLDRAMGTK